MTNSTVTRAASRHPRIGYCQKHASARFRPLIPADQRPDRRFRTSEPVDYDPNITLASDRSINRYYDPATAQFLSVDPEVSITQEPYEYADDDPVNETDPSGLCVNVLWQCIGNGGETSSIGFRFDPGAGANAIVNIGRGASFGYSDKIANWIQPGASCTVAHNSVDEFIGGASTVTVGVAAVVRAAPLLLPTALAASRWLAGVNLSGPEEVTNDVSPPGPPWIQNQESGPQITGPQPSGPGFTGPGSTGPGYTGPGRPGKFFDNGNG
jgi:RHS repeat-associated protein